MRAGPPPRSRQLAPLEARLHQPAAAASLEGTRGPARTALRAGRDCGAGAAWREERGGRSAAGGARRAERGGRGREGGESGGQAAGREAANCWRPLRRPTLASRAALLARMRAMRARAVASRDVERLMPAAVEETELERVLSAMLAARCARGFESASGNPRQCERAHGPPSGDVSQHDLYLKRPTKPSKSAMGWATGI